MIIPLHILFFAKNDLAMAPEDIPLGWYTHINFAFALIDPQTFRIAPMDAQTASLYKRVTSLKIHQPDLKVWIGRCISSFFSVLLSNDI